MRRLILFLLVLFVVLPVRAQQFWVKKEFSQWNERECKKLLEDSPWARSRVIGTAVLREGGEFSPVEGRASEPQITYVAQLWSALPVRQAAIRQAQLSKAFQKLPEADRKALKEKHTAVLAADFGDRIVVKILYTTNVPEYLQNLTRYWRNRSAEHWAQDTFLLTNTGRFAPMETRLPPEGGEIQLIFRREENGQPLIRPTDKTFSLEFVHPTTGPLSGQRVLLEFKVNDLKVNHQPQF